MKQALTSIAAGLGRTARAPKLLLALWLVNVLAALPAALVMSEVLADSIGPSLFYKTLTEGFDADWYAEFSADAEGFADSFRPSVIGIGAVYDNLEAWWSGRLAVDFPTALVGLGVAYAVLWTFLLGGVLSALSPGPGRSAVGGMAGFLGAGSRTFGRFLQLAVAAGVLYYLVYKLSRRLFQWVESSTRQVTVEHAIFLRVLVVAAFTVTLLHLLRLVFDYAKIAVFAGDVSAYRGLVRGVSFVASRPFSCLVVYGVVGVLTLIVIALYAWVAPGAGQVSGVLVLLAFMVSQVYLVGRLALRLGLLASELDFFRASS